MDEDGSSSADGSGAPELGLGPQAEVDSESAASSGRPGSPQFSVDADDKFTRELAEMSQRFSDWADANIYEKATGVIVRNAISANDQFSLRPTSDEKFIVSRNLGLAEDLLDSLYMNITGHPDDVSFQGKEAIIDLVMKQIPEAFENYARYYDPEVEPSEQIGAQISDGIKAFAKWKYGLKSADDYRDEATEERFAAEERRIFAERWVQIHINVRSDWWTVDQEPTRAMQAPQTIIIP